MMIKLAEFVKYCMKSDDEFLVIVGVSIMAMLLVLVAMTVFIWIIPVGVYQYLKWRKENGN